MNILSRFLLATFYEVDLDKEAVSGDVATTQGIEKTTKGVDGLNGKDSILSPFLFFLIVLILVIVIVGLIFYFKKIKSKVKK